VRRFGGASAAAAVYSADMTSPGSIWDEYGFSANPYSTDPIDPSAGGRDLLVGRAKEVRLVTRQLASGASVVALEGDFGVGKTSLAASAAFDAEAWAAGGGAVFIPSRSRLSLKPTDTRETFERRAMFTVASALVDKSDWLRANGRELPGVKEVAGWLTASGASGWSASAGASIAGFGGNLGGSKTGAPNTSAGFSEAGFYSVIDGWLELLFPKRENGGVICFLDNLEELQDSATALRVMEPLRDPLFKRRGVVWIVSGAQGMVRAAYSSPKMTGVFLDPIEVAPLPVEAAPEVISKRIDLLAAGAGAIVPVSAIAFADVYQNIGHNLRYTLNLAERYSFSTDAETLTDLTQEERDARFDAWVRSEADRVYDAYAREMTRADWKVFETLLRDKSGSCSPSDFADFGYGNMPPLLVRVKKLEKLNLVTYTVDTADQRRRTISVTDHGRLAYYRKMTG
jgi:DNA-binding MarR family transcriptional regulator